jgi:hypothetical protein
MPMPSSSSDIRNNGIGFLGDLEASIKRYRYLSKQHAIRIVNEEAKEAGTSGEWILFTGIDKKTFTHDFLNTIDENGDRTLNWSSFDNTLNLLLAKMPPQKPHEEAIRSFDKLLMDALRPMGLDEALHQFGSAIEESPKGGKQADSQWSPIRLPRGRSRDRPTIVLEVALSERYSKLNSDVRYWLQPLPTSEDVKIAITLRINRQQPEIIVEKWERENNHPHRKQCVTISMRANKEITVHGDPLIIEFQKLFLRPTEPPRETDLHIDAEMLKRLAVKVWYLQEFLSPE